MKRIISALALILTVATSAAALVIPTEQISGSIRSGMYANRYQYSIGYFDDAIHVDIDYAFMGPMSDTLWNRWETGIESIWSTNRFSTPILFNVDRVDIASPYDYLIKVQAGSGRADVTHWYVTSTGRTAAHEFGHQIGNFDEYPGSGLDPETGYVNTGGLMDTGFATLDYYYDDILSWYESKLDGLGTGGNNPAAVPEPSTVILLGAGLLAMAAKVRRRTE